ELEVRFPSPTSARHLTLCNDALTVLGDGEHHTLGEIGILARPGEYIGGDSPAIFARDVTDVEVQHRTGVRCGIVGAEDSDAIGNIWLLDVRVEQHESTRL